MAVDPSASRRERTPRRVEVGRRNIAHAHAVKAERLAAAKAAEEALAEKPPTLTTTPKQDEFLAAVFSGQYRDLAMGGGIRGTKTWAVLEAITLLCRIYPGSRWAIVRKDLPTLKKTTLVSFAAFRQTCSTFLSPVSRTDWTVQCANGSEIVFFPESLPDDPEYNRWRGLEVNGFVLEEANELAEATKNKAIERAGAWVIRPGPDGNPVPQPPPLRLYTFNPCDEWPRDMFYEPYIANTLPSGVFFLPATIEDNPYASTEYRESLKDLPEAEYKRFVMGDWGRLSDPNQLIRFEWIQAATCADRMGGEGREAVDVGWYGDDPTVFARTAGNALVELQSYHGLSIDQTAALVAKRIALHGTPVSQYKVDGVGIGAGVYDDVRAAGFDVLNFSAGSSAVDRRLDLSRSGKVTDAAVRRAPPSLYEFPDLRSQAWWEFREKMRLGLVRIGNPPDAPRKEAVTNALLVQDLLAVRYEITRSGGALVITVESKKSLKKRLGRSTDYGDAVVMVYFDLPRWLPPVFRPGDFAKVVR